MTTPAPVCASPGCDKAVPRRPGPGRPPIYCSPDCRTRRRQHKIIVEVDHPELSPDGRPVTRVWTVRLRRGHHVVVIADNLGWPTANALACQLDHLLHPALHQNGAAIE